MLKKLIKEVMHLSSWYDIGVKRENPIWGIHLHPDAIIDKVLLQFKLVFFQQML